MRVVRSTELHHALMLHIVFLERLQSTGWRQGRFELARARKMDLSSEQGLSSDGDSARVPNLEELTATPDADSEFRRLTGIKIQGFRSIVEAPPAASKAPRRERPRPTTPVERVLAEMNALMAQNRKIRLLDEATVPLAPLTVIVEPNGSGKSNILGAIQLCSTLSSALLKQGVHEEEHPDAGVDTLLCQGGRVHLPALSGRPAGGQLSEGSGGKIVVDTRVIVRAYRG